MKKMFYGMTLFFGGLIGVIGFFLVAVLGGYSGDLTSALAEAGLIVHTIIAWIFLFVGLFVCGYEAYSREANQKQSAQKQEQTDTEA